MNETRPRRMLLEEWNSPSDPTDIVDCEESSDVQTVAPRAHRYLGEIVTCGGVFYQRCGGGVRIIRKKTGSV